MSYKQMTLAMQSDSGFEKHRKPTRRDEFLAQMDKVVPWLDLCALIAPVYPQARERGGRRPIGLERMLRIYFFAAVVRPFGPWGGRIAVRLAGDASVRGDRSWP